MEYIRKAMENLEESQRGLDRARTITFEEFLVAAARPIPSA